MIGEILEADDLDEGLCEPKRSVPNTANVEVVVKTGPRPWHSPPIGVVQLERGDTLRDLSIPTVDEAFHSYGRYVAHIALSVLGQRGEVEDVVQDVFLEATRGWSSIRDATAVKAWLATVTIRVARRRLQRKRLRIFFLGSSGDDYADVADSRASPEQRALLSSVYRALRRLPADEQVAWTLRYVQRESLDQVAVMLGCSLATAKRRIAAAHRRLQEAVGHE